MNSEIMSKLWNYLSQNPDVRFCQALYILGINELSSVFDKNMSKSLLRDNFNDTDERVLKRMKSIEE